LTKIAFVFPGQGSQYVGMGQALAETSPAAAATFREADAALGEPLSELTWTGEASELDQTVNAQPAILVTSVAYLRALEEVWERDHADAPDPAFYAGHSMGQYSALVAASVLDIADAVRLVRERGRQMQASADGGAMAAVIGLDDARLPELEAAGRAKGAFTIANRNSPGQVVISGTQVAVEAAAETAKKLGAKRAMMLPVSVAAHSPLMEQAAAGMREVLRDVTFRDPRAPLLANADARPITTGEQARTELVEHLTTGVDWVRAVQTMSSAGVSTFIEIGPGKVLTGLIRRIAPDATVLPVDDQGSPGRLAVPALESTLTA